VYENQIDLFKKGQKVVVTTNANPNKEIEGNIDFIDPILNKGTRTLKLRVVLENKDGFLKPGMFAEAIIKNSENNKNETLSIPASAVLWTGKRSVVYLKTAKDEPVFKMQQITLGNKIGDSYQVLEGLHNGDEIVTNGTFTVDAAAQLQGKKSMMNRNSGKLMINHDGDSEKENSVIHSKTNLNKRIEVSKDFQNQLKTVFNSYINLKDALVKDDVKSVITASKEILENLDKIDIKLVKDDESHTYFMTLKKETKKSTMLISKTSNIKEQRNYFKDVSLNLTSIVEIFGINENVYLQFCPMADSNNGAYWLSKEDNVINPYYGEAMLTCGEVKQIIK
jgi:Cu(I)/Ag(I) efflux system membrane fusion protein